MQYTCSYHGFHKIYSLFLFYFFFPKRLIYKTLFGGVEGFWSEHFRTVNGFPNRFWGWGGEDDDLFVRFVTGVVNLFTRQF